MSWLDCKYASQSRLQLSVNYELLLIIKTIVAGVILILCSKSMASVECLLFGHICRRWRLLCSRLLECLLGRSIFCGLLHAVIFAFFAAAAVFSLILIVFSVSQQTASNLPQNKKDESRDRIQGKARIEDMKTHPPVPSKSVSNYDFNGFR